MNIISESYLMVKPTATRLIIVLGVYYFIRSQRDR